MGLILNKLNNKWITVFSLFLISIMFVHPVSADALVENKTPITEIIIETPTSNAGGDDGEVVAEEVIITDTPANHDEDDENLVGTEEVTEDTETITDPVHGEELTEIIIEQPVGNVTESDNEGSGSSEEVLLTVNQVVNETESTNTENDLLTEGIDTGNRTGNESVSTVIGNTSDLVSCNGENCTVTDDLPDGSTILTTVTSLVSEEKPVVVTGGNVAVAAVTITIKTDGECLGFNGCTPGNAGYIYDNTNSVLTLNGNANYKSYQFQSGATYTFKVVIAGSDVVLDGNGAKLQVSTTDAMVVSNDGVTIKNFEEINSSSSGGRGLYSNDTSGLVITNNTITGIFYGIDLLNSTKTTISGNKITGSNSLYFGIHLHNSTNTIISDNKITNNSKASGVTLKESTNTFISDNMISGNGEKGVSLDTSTNTIISDNTITDNRNGIELWNSTDTKVSGNIIGNNSNADLSFYYNQTSSVIYNNYFNSSNAISGTPGTGVSFNVAPTVGTNIVGGGYIAGNYWSDPNGTGFSDDLTNGNPKGYNTTTFHNGDKAPLVKTIYTPTPEDSQTTQKSTPNKNSKINKPVDIEPTGIIIPEIIKPGESAEIEITFYNLGEEDLPPDAEILFVPQNDAANSIGEIPIIYNGKAYVLNQSFQIPEDTGEYSYIFQPKQLIDDTYISVGNPVEIIITVSNNKDVTLVIKKIYPVPK